MQRARGDASGTAYALHHLGEVARMQGRYGQAADYYTAGLALFEQLPGSAWIIARTLQALGYALLRTGDTARARARLEDSLRRAQHLDGLRLVAVCLAGLGGVALRSDQPERAARLLASGDALIASTHQGFSRADQLAFDPDVAAAQTRLGPEDWGRARAWGESVTPEVAAAYALAGDATPGAFQPGYDQPALRAPAQRGR